MKKRSSRPKSSSLQRPLQNFLILFFGICLLGLLLIQETNFRWLGVPLNIPGPFWNFLLVISLGLIGYGFYQIPTKSTSDDLSKWVAYPILAFILGVAAYLRFVRADQAYSGYWADPAIEIADVCEMVQKHVFFVIFPEGGREPLFSYIAALIWWIFPSLKALLVQRLTANVINLITIWLFYRLGREFSGKRYVGIMFAALGAASKGLLLLNLCGMRVTTLAFGISLMMLLQVKLLKKMTLAHFIFWGMALAAGLYTYTVIRLWIPLLAILTFGFVLWKTKNHKIALWIKVGSAMLLFFYLSFYLDKMLGIQNMVSKIWMPNLLIWTMWQCLFGGLFIYGYRLYKAKEQLFCAFVLGLLITSVLSQPIALHPEVAARITDQSLLPKTLAGWFSIEFCVNIFSHFKQAFFALFWVGSGRSDMNVLGDCFFDFQASVLIVIGLVYAVVKPTWSKFLLVLASLVALVPYWLTSDIHMAKISGTAVPLLLLAVLAAGNMTETSFKSGLKTRWIGFIFILGLSIFWGWEVQSTYQRVFDKWWWEVWNDDVCVGRAVDKELPNRRVYLTRILDSIPHSGQFFDVNTQAVLHDNEAVYLLQTNNVIDVRTGEDRKDVVVILSPLMKELVQKIKKDFPKSTWEPSWQFYQKSHDEIPFLYSVLIPADQISDKPGKLFSFRVLGEDFWRRKVYVSRLGFREGVVESEDLNPKLNPAPMDAKSHAVGAEGNWIAPQDGNYVFSLEGSDNSQVLIDGKESIVLRAYETGKSTKTFFLKKGTHHIRIASYLILGVDFPKLSIENKDLNYEIVLGS